MVVVDTDDRVVAELVPSSDTGANLLSTPGTFATIVFEATRTGLGCHDTDRSMRDLLAGSLLMVLVGQRTPNCDSIVVESIVVESTVDCSFACQLATVLEARSFSTS